MLRKQNNAIIGARTSPITRQSIYPRIRSRDPLELAGRIPIPIRAESTRKHMKQAEGTRRAYPWRRRRRGTRWRTAAGSGRGRSRRPRRGRQRRQAGSWQRPRRGARRGKTRASSPQPSASCRRRRPPPMVALASNLISARVRPARSQREREEREREEWEKNGRRRKILGVLGYATRISAAHCVTWA